MKGMTNMYTFECEKRTYASQIDSRTDTLTVTRIAPYDFTNYHWARKNTVQDAKTVKWTAYRNGKFVEPITFSHRFADEETEVFYVAKALIELDKEAKLIPHIDRT